MGNSPWDCKESDMTDRLTFSLSHLLVFLGPGIWEQLGRAVLTHEGTVIGQRAPPPEGSPGAGGVPSKEAHSHGCEMVRRSLVPSSWARQCGPGHGSWLPPEQAVSETTAEASVPFYNSLSLCVQPTVISVIPHCPGSCDGPLRFKEREHRPHISLSVKQEQNHILNKTMWDGMFGFNRLRKIYLTL